MDFKFEKLVLLRKAKNLTQSEIAKKCKVTRSGYRDWENGKNIPKTNSFYALCAVLEVAPEVLSDDAKQFPDYFNKEYSRYKLEYGNSNIIIAKDKVAVYNNGSYKKAKSKALLKIRQELDDILDSLYDPAKQDLAAKALKELVKKLKNLKDL